MTLDQLRASTPRTDGSRRILAVIEGAVRSVPGSENDVGMVAGALLAAMCAVGPLTSSPVEFFKVALECVHGAHRASCIGIQ
jgi:hypothetical protein